MSSCHTNGSAKACCGPGYASPAAAIQAEPEKLLYTIALYVGTDIQEPDYIATIDVDPDSPTYSQVIHRLPMPHIGDELHHFEARAPPANASYWGRITPFWLECL